MESQTLEYKATLRTHAHSGEVYKPLETASLKTLAAFLNSPLGGTLSDPEVLRYASTLVREHKHSHPLTESVAASCQIDWMSCEGS